MASKSVLLRGFMAEAERISEKYRAEMGISKFEPLDAFQLGKYLEIGIYSVEEIYGESSDHPSYSAMCDPSKFSAMWMYDSRGVKMVIHNHNHSPYRQQSNLMHELAHIIRKHTIPEESAALCAQFGLHYYNQLHEQEAKYLGGCLQITRPGLQWAYKNLGTFESISEYYSASVEMVKYRMGITGVTKQYSYR